MFSLRAFLGYQTLSMEPVGPSHCPVLSSSQWRLGGLGAERGAHPSLYVLLLQRGPMLPNAAAVLLDNCF